MRKNSHFSGQPLPQDSEMDETATDHRLYDNHVVLKSAFQGCQKASKDRKEERGHQGTYSHTHQRRRSLRHKVYIGCDKQFFHAQADSTVRRRYNGYGPRLY